MPTYQELAIMFRAIEAWGEDSQMKMLLEEMSELQKEICKSWRGANNVDHIAEEIADVEIMLEQLKLMTGSVDKVKTFREQKLRRLEQRLDEYEKKGN